MRITVKVGEEIATSTNFFDLLYPWTQKKEFNLDRISASFSIGNMAYLIKENYYLCIMKNTESIQELLKSASKSVKRAAQRNGRPIAISEDGQVKIISPDKKVKRVRKSLSKKQKA